MRDDFVGRLLPKLVDDEEAYGGGGPAFPRSSYPDAAVRAQLEVWYMAS